MRISDVSSDVCSSDLQNRGEIVPMGGDLLVEGKIHPSDRAELRPGLEAVVKVSAYDYAIYGGLNATLIGISPDTLTDEEGESYYRVRFRADAQGFAADKPRSEENKSELQSPMRRSHAGFCLKKKKKN